MSPRTIALLAALVVLAGCEMTDPGNISRYGTCYDSQGFPVPCPPSPHDVTPFLALEGNANGALVADANDDLVAFEASAPHVLVVGAHREPTIELTPEGELLELGRLAGYVALVETAAGERIAALVAADGTLLDVVLADGVARLVSTIVPAPLVDVADAPYLSDAVLRSGLPVAGRAETADGGDPRVPVRLGADPLR
jgi:hypothetical protein